MIFNIFEFDLLGTISSVILIIILIFCGIKFNVIYAVLTAKIDPNDKRHGGMLVAETLKAHKIEHLFTLIGGHISPILVAAEALNIDVVDTRNEATAVFAADAYSRLSGIIGVAVVTAGPGLTNTITAMKNAQMAEIPLLLLGGAAATLLKGRGSLQDIDQLSLFKSVCKYTKSVRCVRDIVPTLKKAIQTAYSATPGPVFVELPLDVLYPYKLVKQEMKIQENPKGLIPILTNKFLKLYLRYLFASAFEHPSTSPLPVYYPLASDNTIEKCQALLSQCRKPLILLGSQATIPSKYVFQLEAALKVLNIPCYLSGMARGLLGKNSPLQLRHKRKEAIQEADLIILAGTVCDFRLSYGRIFKRSSKIIAVNIDKDQLTKNSGILWSPALSIKAMPADFIIRLAENSSRYSFQNNWLAILKERDESSDKLIRSKTVTSGSKHLNPVTLLYNLDQALPDNTIIVADGGDFVSTAAYIMRPRGPLMWLDPGAFGTLGVGAGFALGAKMVHPDCTVIIIYGDGSCGYSIAEFDTFVRRKIPVLALIGNDACWTQIARSQIPMFQSDVACNLAFSGYEKVVEAFGGIGILMSEDDNEENLIEKITKGLHLLREQKTPVLLNALIGKTDFRDGSISV